MDRSFILIDAIRLPANSDQFKILKEVHRQGLTLWSASELAWSTKHTRSLQSNCELFDIDDVEFEAIDQAVLKRLFPEPASIQNNHMLNGIVDALQITHSAAAFIESNDEGEIRKALDAYYDIFYQPTVDSGHCANIETKEPLKYGLIKLQQHVTLLKQSTTVSFGDIALRG